MARISDRAATRARATVMPETNSSSFAFAAAASALKVAF